MTVLQVVALATSVSALVYVLVTTRRIAEQRDRAIDAAFLWRDMCLEAQKELEELKKEAQNGVS